MPTSGAMYGVQFVDCILRLSDKKKQRENWVEGASRDGRGRQYVHSTPFMYSVDPWSPGTANMEPWMHATVARVAALDPFGTGGRCVRVSY